MQQHRQGSGTLWGPLFAARAGVWADTWEGPEGWGTPVYEHVLDAANVGSGTTVLDCGCGAGRFVRLAADRGAAVAGIDAAADLVEIAASRSPRADLRVGDFEALPWSDGFFDVVTGFSTFQFADDHVRALGEGRRVSRGPVWVVIPTRLAESGIPQVFAPLMALFPPQRAAHAQAKRNVSPCQHRASSTRYSPPSGCGHDATTQSTRPSCSPTPLSPLRPSSAPGRPRSPCSTPANQRSKRRSTTRSIRSSAISVKLPLPGWFRVVEAS